MGHGLEGNNSEMFGSSFLQGCQTWEPIIASHVNHQSAFGCRQVEHLQGFLDEAGPFSHLKDYFAGFSTIVTFAHDIKHD